MSEAIIGGRPITDILRDMAGGLSVEAATDALQEVSMAVLEAGKEGSVTITLKVKPNGPRSVVITDDIKKKVPDMDRGDTIFFADDAGVLVRDDPRQGKLNLRDVNDDGKTELKEVGNV